MDGWRARWGKHVDYIKKCIQLDWISIGGSSNGGFMAQKTIFSNSLKWWKINNWVFGFFD